MLHESFGHVQSIGRLFALDFEYYLESESSRCYRLLWTNRLAAETRSGRLVRHEGGTIRSGPASETISAVTDAVPELRHFRQRQSRSKKKAA
ncbi:MAG: hypothetical protein ABSF50_23680 [Burkholderiaceae bacterium]